MKPRSGRQMSENCSNSRMLNVSDASNVGGGRPNTSESSEARGNIGIDISGYINGYIKKHRSKNNRQTPVNPPFKPHQPPF